MSYAAVCLDTHVPARQRGKHKGSIIDGELHGFTKHFLDIQASHSNYIFWLYYYAQYLQVEFYPITIMDKLRRPPESSDVRYFDIDTINSGGGSQGFPEQPSAALQRNTELRCQTIHILLETSTKYYTKVRREIASWPRTLPHDRRGKSTAATTTTASAAGADVLQALLDGRAEINRRTWVGRSALQVVATEGIRTKSDCWSSVGRSIQPHPPALRRCVRRSWAATRRPLPPRPKGGCEQECLGHAYAVLQH